MCMNNKIKNDQWKQDKLELPVVIRKPNEFDISNNDSILKACEERDKVILVEGYTYKKNMDQQDINYMFYSEINIDNSRLWDLFLELLNNIDGEAYVVFYLHGDEEEYGAKMPIHNILSILKRLRLEIVNNCNLNIGIVQNSTLVTEVFIDESKYIKYWGNDYTWFKSIMNKHSIPENQEMNFVDEFPKIVYDWNYINNKSKTDQEIKEYLKDNL